MSDPLRYKPQAPDGASGGEIAFLKIRYKLPGETQSHLITRPIGDADMIADFAKVPDDMRFAAAVAGSAQLLRHDPYVKDFALARAIEIAESARGDDRYGYRKEFVALLRGAQKVQNIEAVEAK
jgi:Ca-activated chloride channel family protein